MIRDIARRLEFPEEAVNLLGECFDKMIDSEDGNDQLALAMDAFFGSKDYRGILDCLSEQTGYHPYSVDMTFLLLCVDALHDIYYIKELPEELFWNTMQELKGTLTECKNRHDIWGTDAIHRLRDYFFNSIA